jgi:Tfp pilus assembly protein PilN
MRAVNLLPARYRPRRATGERPGIAYAALGILAVLFAMVLAYVLTNNGIHDANSKAAQAQAEQAQAQAKIGALQAYGNFAALKTSREDAVKGVAEVRFDWERLMREMALVLPHNVYLTQFTAAPGGATSSASGTTGAITATGPAITINGCAPGHPDVATTLVRLKKLHNVVDVELTSSTKSTGTTATNSCPTQFVASLTFQAESAPTAGGPVPARLGGGQ